MSLWTERDKRFMAPIHMLICGDVGTTILYDPKPNRLIVIVKIGPDLYQGTSCAMVELEMWYNRGFL
jgi:hypothetical protein